MSVTVLTEDSINEFIKQDFVVIKAWGEVPTKDGLKPCPYCLKYEPFFEAASEKMKIYKFGSIKLEAPSEFKRTHMKNDKGEEKGSIPATFVFENGELKYKHFGYLQTETLETFIKTGQTVVSIKDIETRELESMGYRAIRNFEIADRAVKETPQYSNFLKADRELREINQEIETRYKG